MVVKLIDGIEVAAKVRAEAAALVERTVASTGVVPGLAVILVGDDPASHAYVGMKERDCEQVGIASFDYRRAADITQAQLDAIVDECNANPLVHGVLVQMPLPQHLDAEQTIERVDPAKDVDGFHAENLGRLVRGIDGPRACTPWGVMRLLDEYGVELSGKHAVVVGRSTIVGKPQALMLLERDATVTVCHSRTADLAAVCRTADVLVAAVGRPKMITAEYIKPGAVVIDVGISRVEERLVGDVDNDSVSGVASMITPVPGGVGPMTRAMLMLNTARAAAKAAGLDGVS